MTITPGEHFAKDPIATSITGEDPHLWNTLGFRRTAWEPGMTGVEWEANEHYCFPTAGGPVVQGGLVTAILDAAMGGATWTVLDLDQAFLTADIRVEFHRMSRPGLLRATGTVLRRTRRVVFCSGELSDASGQLLATSRCTQIVLSGGDHPARRYAPPDPSGEPPKDARG